MKKLVGRSILLAFAAAVYGFCAALVGPGMAALVFVCSAGLSALFALGLDWAFEEN